jgi:hypothetical protein
MSCNFGRTVKFVLMISNFILAALTLTATAQTATWCALYHGGNQDCSFATFGQCEQASVGLGGTCVQNSGTPPPNLLQRMWRQRQQDVRPSQLPGGTVVPPPPDSND